MFTFRARVALLCLVLIAAPVHPQEIPREIDGKSFEQWKADLSHADPRVRAGAAFVIPKFRFQAMHAVPLLVERTRDQDCRTRLNAVVALQLVLVRGVDRIRVVKALGQRVSQDTDPMIRCEAARALARFGTDTHEVLKELAQGVGDTSSWEMRHACIVALMGAWVNQKTGPDPRVTHALLRRLNPVIETSIPVRVQAMIALGTLGPPADRRELRQVVVALTTQSDDSNKEIRIWSRASLMVLEDTVHDGDLKTIAGYLTDGAKDVRIQAATALGALGVKALPSRSALSRLMQHEKEPQVLAAACLALERIALATLDAMKTLPWTIDHKKHDEESKKGIRKDIQELRTAEGEMMDNLQKVLDRDDLDEQTKGAVRSIIQKLRSPTSERNLKRPAR